jgi:hypothetical protein
MSDRRDLVGGLVAGFVGWVRGKERAIVYALAALTVVSGAVLSHRAGDKVRSMDEPEFYDVARNLAQAGTYAHTNTPGELTFNTRFPIGARVPTAYQAPGYPLALAPLALVGAGYAGMRTFNFVLVALTMLLVFQLLAEHRSPLAGLLGVVGALAYPVVLYTAGTLYPQTLGSFLLVLTVWLAVSIKKDSGLGRYLALAISAGAMALAVPTLLLIIPVLAVWLAFARRPPLWKGAVTVVALVVVVGSWTVRNAVTFGRFVPIASSAGFNLASGNCDAARYNTSLDVRFADSVYTELTGKDEIDANRVMTHAGVDWIEHHPQRFVVLYVGKFLHWFDYSNKLLSDTVVKGGASDVSSGKRDLIMLAIYGTMLLLLGARIALSRRIPWTSFEVLSVLLYVGLGLAYALFFTRIRFRLPVDWLLVAVDAGFVAALAEGRGKVPVPIAASAGPA